MQPGRLLGKAALFPPATSGLGPATGGPVRKQQGGSPVKLYDFGILLIAALVAAAVAAAILSQVHH